MTPGGIKPLSPMFNPFDMQSLPPLNDLVLKLLALTTNEMTV
jgi:hypothetical protein